VVRPFRSLKVVVEVVAEVEVVAKNGLEVEVVAGDWAETTAGVVEAEERDPNPHW